MKIKVMYILLILTTLVGMIINFRVHAPYNEANGQNEVNERIETATLKLEQLYENKEEEFLVTDINNDKLTEIRNLINFEEAHTLATEHKTKFNELNNELSIIEQMVNLEVKVNDLLIENDSSLDTPDFNIVIDEIQQLEDVKPQFVTRNLQIIEELKNKEQVIPAPIE